MGKTIIRAALFAFALAIAGGVALAAVSDSAAAYAPAIVRGLDGNCYSFEMGAIDSPAEGNDRGVPQVVRVTCPAPPAAPPTPTPTATATPVAAQSEIIGYRQEWVTHPAGSGEDGRNELAGYYRHIRYILTD